MIIISVVLLLPIDVYFVSKSDMVNVLFVFKAEDGIRDLVRSRGFGDVYKRQGHRH